LRDNESIKEGDIWPDKIKTALEQSKIVLVIIGNNWLCTERTILVKIGLCGGEELDQGKKLKQLRN